MAYPYGGINSISLGIAAGSTLQGPAAIAIGYQAGVISQPASSIVINATGSSLSGVAPNALYIAPIRNLISGTLLMYDTLNKEVVYSSTLNNTFTANNIVALSTLSASTVNFSTLILNTANVSTANVQILNYSSLSGSTITANTGFINSTLTVSTLIAANINVSSLALDKFSTLTGSSLIASTVAISTITANTGFINSTLTVSTLNASTINTQFMNLLFSSISSVNGSSFGNTGPRGETGPSTWLATGLTGPYNTVITYSQGYVGVGPTGTYLQTTSGGAMAGTGSTVPQYPVDVAGTVRNSVNMFGDNSASVTATPALDYTTFGQNWTPTTLPSASWNTVAVSASGQYQSAAGNATGIFYSNNYGQTWTATTSSTLGFIQSIAISASGQYQVAAYNEGIYYSNNYGVSWTPSNAPSSYWFKICISSSGQYASACSQPTPSSIVPYYSNNYGVTWIPSNGATGSYQSIACSASGQYQVAGIISGGIYYSFNYGQSWTLSDTTNIGGRGVGGGAMSASGQYASIVTRFNGVFITSNYGVTWTQIIDVIGSFELSNVSVSASGQYQVTSAYGTGIYYSINYGATWVQGLASGLSWYGVGMSANGQYCLACVPSGQVYQSVTRSSPSGTILPLSDSVYNIGGSSPYRFAAVYAVNGTIQTSDSSEKDLILLPYGLNEVMQVRTIMYKWKSQALLPDTDPIKNFQYYGVCADQLSNIFPELVYNEDPNVSMQLNYSELIPVVIKAIQEQNIIIQQQPNKLQQQATEITALQSTVATQATEITALQSTVAAQSTQVLQTQVNAQQIQIAQLMSRLAAAGIP